MKQILQISFILILLVFVGCSGHHKQRINLSGFSDRNEVVYETQMVKFILSENAIIDYCNKKDTIEQNNFIYRQVIEYLNKHQNKSIIIADTLGTELIPDSTITVGSTDSTLVRIRNQKSEYAYVTEAVGWMLLDLVQNGEIKVYDKKTSKFVNYVFLDEENTNGFGAAHILLPNDSLIFSKLRWIR